jgi:dihydrofolate reductase
VIVSIIVAMDEAGGIGSKGGLPWHLSADLKNFKTLTMGHHLIVGRKTYQSIGKALPGRTTIIVTRNRHFRAEDCLLAYSLADALALAEQSGEEEAFIGGGAEIFAQALPLAERIYLTRVHTRADCDVFFPQVEWGEWVQGERQAHPADVRNDHPFTYSEVKKLTNRAIFYP